MVYTLVVGFVETVSSEMMNSIHTCEIDMRSVLFANGMGLEINSQFQFHYRFLFSCVADGYFYFCISFENYESLVCYFDNPFLKTTCSHHYFKERHFNTAHHPCTQADCLARKFVVFDTTLDLKAHTVEEHGGDMSSRDKKDARRVQANFAFEDVGGRHGHGRRDRDRERERDRDPPPPQALRPASPPHQQQAQVSSSSATTTTVPPPGSGARRREAFGGGLTQAGEVEDNKHGISRPSTPQATTEVDQAVIE